MHLLREQGPKGVITKCGSTQAVRADTTVWWSDVTCADCNPMTWVDAPDGLGQMMVKREDAPKKVLKRRKKVA